MNRTPADRQRFDELIDVEIKRRALEARSNELRYSLGLGIIEGTVFEGMKRRGRPRRGFEASANGHGPVVLAAQGGREQWEEDDQERLDSVGRRIGKRVAGKRVLSAAARQKISQAAKAMWGRKQAAKKGKQQKTGSTRPVDQPGIRKKAWETRRARIAEAAKMAEDQGISKSHSKQAPKKASGEWTPERRERQAQLMRERNHRLLAEGRHSSQIGKQAQA